MFYDIEVSILDYGLQKLKTTYADIQPYDKNISFEDGVEIEISKRAFLDIEPVEENGYILTKDKLYKIMKIKTWSDYMELWLYECRQVAI